MHFLGKFTRPWAFMSSSPDMLPARLEPSAESITPFHVAVSGRCWLSCGDLPPIVLEGGDVIVISRGDQHIMMSDPGLKAVPIKEIYAHPSRDQITVLEHGGGGEETRFICGYAGIPPASWRKTKASAEHPEDEQMGRNTATRDSRIQPLISTEAVTSLLHRWIRPRSNA